MQGQRHDAENRQNICRLKPVKTGPLGHVT